MPSEADADQAASRPRVHVLGERLHVLDRRLRQHAVAEIEDVSRPAAGARAARRRRRRAGDRAGRTAARDPDCPGCRAVGADRRPRLVEALTPVDADHVAAGLGEIRQDGRRADAEVDQRHAGVGEAVEDPLACAAARTRDSRRGRARRPTNRRSAAPARRRRPAPAGSRSSTSAKSAQSRCHAARLLVHERLGAEIVRRRPAFDRVGRQRERRAAEPDQRHASFELAAQEPDRLEHVRRAPRAARTSSGASTSAADRMGFVDRRAFAFDEIELEAHRREGEQQVGEEDRGVDVDDVDRLQRDVDGELRLAAELEQRVASRGARGIAEGSGRPGA